MTTSYLKSITEIIAKKSDTTRYPYFRVSDNPKGNLATEADKRHDPYGVYLFIKGQHVDVEEWHSKKYRWDAKIKSGLKILDLDKINYKLGRKLLEDLGLRSLQDVWELGSKSQSRGGYDIPYEEIDALFYPLRFKQDKPTEKELENTLRKNRWLYLYRVIRLLYPTHIKSNRNFSRLFESCGYDGLLDLSGNIYTGEPQLVVFNPSNVIWGERYLNSGELWRHQRHGIHRSA